MTSAETPPDPRESTTVSMSELTEAYVALRRWFHVVLLLLLVLSCSFGLYLLREVSLVRRQMRDLNSYVSNYERTHLPVMIEIRTKLYEFAQRNPDFMVIFMKYFNPTNAPATAPAPDPQGASSLRLPPTEPQ